MPVELLWAHTGLDKVLNRLLIVFGPMRINSSNLGWRAPSSYTETGCRLSGKSSGSGLVLPRESVFRLIGR